MSQFPLTAEQQAFVEHASEAFAEACPGAGKTRAVVARLIHVARTIPPRKGVALLSFTNSAIEVFVGRCRLNGVEGMLKHPGFIGTFDSFVGHFFIGPGGASGTDVRPTIVDSWDTLGVEVRLRGSSTFSGPGVRLDDFDPENNQILLDRIGHLGLRRHVTANQAEYARVAEEQRRRLRRNGYLSAADARVEAWTKLQQSDWSRYLGRALAGRFYEVIVDEAQDCNPLDLQILQWLRSQGLPVVIVSDIDQAIYGFRHGSPDKLREFQQTYAANDRLNLTGNFRSSRPICALASTLRTRNTPDESLGSTKEVNIPMHLIFYSGQSVTPAIGDKFFELITNFHIDPARSVILAHARRIACRAAGVILSSDDTGNSRVAALARATICEFWSSSASNRTREKALRETEKLVLTLMGKIADNESPHRAAEKHEINRRWLRRTALELITRLPRSCDDSNAGRASWITTLHQEVDRLSLNYGPGISAARFFPRSPNAKWSKSLRQADAPRLSWSTIHEAKGREYAAVCVVLPPDRGNADHTSKLFEVWESRTEDEAKRVIYVGVTRAERLVAVAVPEAFSERMIRILDDTSVPKEVC
jgi:DNA helicase II / ATP-dependent DNA helicase PcrA